MPSRVRDTVRCHLFCAARPELRRALLAPPTAQGRVGDLKVFIDARRGTSPRHGLPKGQIGFNEAALPPQP